MANEIWKPVPGWEGYYEVSNRGRVRSLDRINAQGHRKKGRTLRPKRKKGGYRQVTLYRDGASKGILVHRLVTRAFLGECPAGMEVAHNDGDPANNRLDNLRFATHVENMKDREAHGTTARGERQGSAKLTEADVHEIHRMANADYTQREIAKVFGVHPSAIGFVLTGRTWQHLHPEYHDNN